MTRRPDCAIILVQHTQYVAASYHKFYYYRLRHETQILIHTSIISMCCHATQLYLISIKINLISK
jgi:hypothetical protein